jgi:hypothetical protein
MPFSGLIKSQYADSGTRSEPAAPLSSTDRCATRDVRCLGLNSTQIVASEPSPDSESIPASEDFKASGRSPGKLMPLLNFDTNFSACCRGNRPALVGSSRSDSQKPLRISIACGQILAITSRQNITGASILFEMQLDYQRRVDEAPGQRAVRRQNGRSRRE